jgi:hypothetical protein
MIWWVGLYSETAHFLFASLLGLAVYLPIWVIFTASSRETKIIGTMLIIVGLFSFGYLSHVTLDWWQSFYGKDWV